METSVRNFRTSTVYGNLDKSISWYSRVRTGLKRTWNLEGFLEKFLKIKSALKSTGKSLKSLEKSLNSTFFCRT